MRLAVHVGRDLPDSLSAVLAACFPWADPVAGVVQEPLPDGVRAHLYTSDVLPRRPSEPFAVWSLGDGPADLRASITLREVGAPALDPSDQLVCVLPSSPSARPVLPFTRTRYRLLRDLPARMVAEWSQERPTWREVGREAVVAPDESWPTLAALSSAVTATGDAVWEALAWAAPTVTDAPTARRLSLDAGEHVLVADDPEERRRLAAGLATDDVAAARLAQRGWRAARDRRPAQAAAVLCARLGLPARRDVAPPSRLVSELDSLGTPGSSLIRRRVFEATAALPGADTAGWWSAERSAR